MSDGHKHEERTSVVHGCVIHRELPPGSMTRVFFKRVGRVQRPEGCRVPAWHGLRALAVAQTSC